MPSLVGRLGGRDDGKAGSKPVVFKLPKVTDKKGVPEGRETSCRTNLISHEPPDSAVCEWDTSKHTPAYFKALYQLEQVEEMQKAEEEKRMEEQAARADGPYFPITLNDETANSSFLRSTNFSSNISRISEAIENHSCSQHTEDVDGVSTASESPSPETSVKGMSRLSPRGTNGKPDLSRFGQQISRASMAASDLSHMEHQDTFTVADGLSTTLVSENTDVQHHSYIPSACPPCTHEDRSVVYKEELAALFNAVQEHVRITIQEECSSPEAIKTASKSMKGKKGLPSKPMKTRDDDTKNVTSYLIEPTSTGTGKEGISYTSPTWVVKAKILECIMNGRFDIDNVALLVNALRTAQHEVDTTRGLLYRCEELLVRERQRNDTLMTREEVAVSRSKYRRMQLVQVATHIHQAVTEGGTLNLPPSQDTPEVWKELQEIMECVRSGGARADITKIDIHQRLIQDLTWRTKFAYKQRVTQRKIEEAEKLAMEGADLLSVAAQEFTVGGDLKVDIMQMLHKLNSTEDDSFDTQNGSSFSPKESFHSHTVVPLETVFTQTHALPDDPRIKVLGVEITELKQNLTAEKKTTMQLRQEKRAALTDAEMLKSALGQKEHEMQALKLKEPRSSKAPPPICVGENLAIISELQEELISTKVALDQRETEIARLKEDHLHAIHTLETSNQIVEAELKQNEEAAKKLVVCNKAVQCENLESTSPRKASSTSPKGTSPTSPKRRSSRTPYLSTDSPRSRRGSVLTMVEVGTEMNIAFADETTMCTPREYSDKECSTTREEKRQTVLGDILNCRTPLELTDELQPVYRQASMGSVSMNSVEVAVSTIDKMAKPDDVAACPIEANTVAPEPRAEDSTKDSRCDADPAPRVPTPVEASPPLAPQSGMLDVKQNAKIQKFNIVHLSEVEATTRQTLVDCAVDTLALLHTCHATVPKQVQVAAPLTPTVGTTSTTSTKLISSEVSTCIAKAANVSADVVPVAVRTEQPEQSGPVLLKKMSDRFDPKKRLLEQQPISIDVGIDVGSLQSKHHPDPPRPVQGVKRQPPSKLPPLSPEGGLQGVKPFAVPKGQATIRGASPRGKSPRRMSPRADGRRKEQKKEGYDGIKTSKDNEATTECAAAVNTQTSDTATKQPEADAKQPEVVPVPNKSQQVQKPIRVRDVAKSRESIPEPPPPPPPAAEVPYLDMEIEDIVEMVKASQQMMEYIIAKEQREMGDKKGKTKYLLALEAKLRKSKERVRKLVKESPFDVHFQVTTVLGTLQKEIAGWEAKPKGTVQRGAAKFGKFGDPSGVEKTTSGYTPVIGKHHHQGDARKDILLCETQLGVTLPDDPLLNIYAMGKGGSLRDANQASESPSPRYTSSRPFSDPPLPKIQGPNPNAHPGVVRTATKKVIPARVPNFELGR